MSTDIPITFIGGGNMTRSLVGGLLQKGFAAARIHVADPSTGQLEHLHRQFSVRTSADNLSAVENAQVVVFAVKPQIFSEAARPLARTLAKTGPLIISIAAGIAEPDIRRWLGYDAAIVRVMPNTPALIGAGATALYANRFVSAAHRTLAEDIFNAVGLSLWLEDEKYMDTVTAVSGSGPAYFFLVMEVIEAAARELGLPANVARQLVQQTAYGAARMALENRSDTVALRKQVTSPNGTTAAALTLLEDEKLREIFLKAITAARNRSVELSHEYGEDKP